tara:strand:- start:743 stop:1147 length:405 start_codon:yes stop_codon:yes gene_type:complete
MTNKVIVTRGRTDTVNAITAPNVTITSQPALTVTTTAIGPQGIQGVQGVVGPQGIQGPTGLAASGDILASKLNISVEGNETAFIIKMPDIGGDEIKFQVNDEGVAVFGQPAEPPSPTPGGMYYLNGVFYLGENA